MEDESSGNDLSKHFNVIVCAGELVFSGVFRCNPSQRLIDALNEGVRESPHSTLVDFLALEEATMLTATGLKRKFPHIFVSKNNIAFVAEESGEPPVKRLNAYPYRRKLPVGVTIYSAQIHSAEVVASSYILKGELFVETWGEVADTIESHDRFLPLTDVEVEPPLPGGESQFNFVAINRHRVISICEGREGT